MHHHEPITAEEQRCHMRRIEALLEAQRVQMRAGVRALNRIAKVLTPAPESQIDSVSIRAGKPVLENPV